MTMALYKLIKRQYSIFDTIKKAANKYKSDPVDKKTISYINYKLDLLKERWTEFNENHRKIEEMEDEDGVVRKELDEKKTQLIVHYLQENMFDEVEEFYSCIYIQIQEDREATLTTDSIQNVSTPNPINSTMQMIDQEVNLPKINIPQFSGDYETWVSFKDLFETLIHNNNKLAKVQKLQYLKSSLQGDAEHFLKHYTVTETNYEPAWKALQERYHNKRILIKNSLKILFSQPSAAADTAYTIRKLIDTTNQCIQSLRGLEVDTKEWDIIFSHVVGERLPLESKKLWEQEVGAEKEFPSYERLKIFLEGRFRTLEALDHNNNYKSAQQKRNFLITKSYKCSICNGPHALRQCPKFLQLNPKERKNLSIEKHLCSNCLAKGHIAIDCSSRSSCYKCKRRHHTLLHDDTLMLQKSENQNENNQNLKPTTSSTNLTSSTLHSNNYEDHVEILLATAIVKATSKKGYSTQIRILLDQGSQSSFVSESIVQKIEAKCTPVNTRILGLANTQTGFVKSRVNIELSSLINNSTIYVNALVLNRLTGILPSQQLQRKKNWNHLKDLKLADPNYLHPGKIDMIIGADKFGSIILNGLRTGPHHTPIAQNTIFGWVISGEVTGIKAERNLINTLNFHNYTQLHEQLRKFWEIEEVSETNVLSAADQKCENFYKQTFKRLSNGKYIVRLPFKNVNERPKFGRSRYSALTRFKHLENKFIKSDEFRLDYAKVLQEYVDLEHMVLVDTTEIENMWHDGTGQTFYNTNYLPHHAVYKESTTTKLRVVFDASNKTFEGPSLNDQLLTGPKIQEDLLWILLRWRKHRIVVTADIEKMYRQIFVNEDDAEFQRILWRTSLDEPIQDYKLRTVTFGTSSAPYLAIRTIHQLARDERSKFPLAAKIAESDFYVDDCLTGSNTVEGAIQAQQQLIKLFSTGGFNLRKWASNNLEVLNEIPESDREISGVLTFDIAESVKTLGLNWYPKTDIFKYKILTKINEVEKITKRKFLSDISKLYDPLGFLAPFIIKLKILMQLIWLRGIDWDEEISTDINNTWQLILKELHIIEKIEIPRWIGTDNNKTELHGFCDGSTHAYSAVIYVRTVINETQHQVRILTAKTKVTPVKQISLPRIELCGALLLANLYKTVKKAIKVDEIKFTAWTDSTIVLSWLRGCPNQYKTFVGNRVAEIQEICGGSSYKYVPTQQNPADCASRGIYPNELLTKTIWWNGPEWLAKAEEEWPKTPKLSSADEEVKTIRVHACQQQQVSVFQNLVEKYSSLTKLLRVTAYIFRFIMLCKKDNKSCKNKYLSTLETETALKFWIKKIQKDEFNITISKKSEKTTFDKSKIASLNPFIDGEGLIRVGGRIDHANISWTEKHPIILPYKNKLTSLILDNIHKSTLHGGPQLMLNLIRTKFWIIQAKNAIKQHIFKCIICFRHKAETSKQLMGNLPTPRVQMTRPFLHTGVDYCGPIEIKTSRLRNAKLQKGYIALFICLSTRAIHIEVVTELTAQAFLAALRRLIGRRGLITDLYSDNATNFVGAKKILRNEFQKHIFELNKLLPEIISHENINWHFIPPVAPHFGGLWEAGVKSTKFHLKRVVSNSKLTFEELTTTTIQIEACLNSRPIYATSQNPDEISALTPGHFLIGAPLLLVPEPSYLDQREHRLNRWQLMQQLVQSFWKRWHTEYLHSLQQRTKWKQETQNVKIGQIVLVKEDNVPPCRWVLAKIIGTTMGNDNLIRVVTIRTNNTNFKRPITKICVLPVEDNPTQ